MDKTSIGLIGRKTYKYNDKITLVIPTVNRIRGVGGEDNNRFTDEFWREVNLFSQSPVDFISELDSMGVDFTRVSDYEFFIFSFNNLKKYCNSQNLYSQIFKGFNLWNLQYVSGENVTLNDGNGVVIDEKIYNDLSDLICYMTCREKSKPKKFGNDYAKKKRIEQDYKKKKKLKEENTKEDSNFFDRLILRLVCDADFPYDFNSIGEISLFEFMYSLKQIEKNIGVDYLMTSAFYGNDLKKHSADDLNRYAI